jgi:transglutaminase-like putative cysteine protease
MLEESPETATNVIKSALPDYPIHRVTEVELEFIPENNESLIGDKSAMDAIIGFEDATGKRGFIAVETKYSENLGTNAASDKDEKGNKKPREQSLKAMRQLKCFNPDVEMRIIEGKVKLTQIYRNFLLSETYGKWKTLESYSIILAPNDHPSTDNEVNSLLSELREEYKNNKIKKINLEDFVNAIIDYCPDAYRVVFERFYDRYLNFGKLDKY